MSTKDAIITTMAKKDTKKTRSDDRHDDEYWRITLRLRGEMGQQLEKLVDLLGTDATHEIRNAIRERLIKFDLWPANKSGD
jgi:hypothetical protein